MPKLQLILNPVSGQQRGKRLLSELIALFGEFGWQSTVFVTRARGDATRFAALYGGEYDRVVCVGGDGTFNETVDGLLSAGLDLPLGYIPCGSTNDFAGSLHLSSDVLQAGRDVMLGHERRLDVGRFNGRCFSYVASFGAFTKASYATPQTVKNALGHLAYILEGMKDIPQIKPLPVRVETDDRVLEGEYIFGAVSNSTSLGGVLSLDPELVDMADGIFEIFLIKPPSNAAALANALRDLRAMHYDDPMIDFVKTSRAVVYAQPDMDWSLDGERQPGTERAVIENLHGAIRLIVNE